MATSTKVWGSAGAAGMIASLIPDVQLILEEVFSLSPDMAGACTRLVGALLVFGGSYGLGWSVTDSQQTKAEADLQIAKAEGENQRRRADDLYADKKQLQDEKR